MKEKETDKKPKSKFIQPEGTVSLRMNMPKHLDKYIRWKAFTSGVKMNKFVEDVLKVIEERDTEYQKYKKQNNIS